MRHSGRRPSVMTQLAGAIGLLALACSAGGAGEHVNGSALPLIDPTPASSRDEAVAEAAPPVSDGERAQLISPDPPLPPAELPLPTGVDRRRDTYHRYLVEHSVERLVVEIVTSDRFPFGEGDAFLFDALILAPADRRGEMVRFSAPPGIDCRGPAPTVGAVLMLHVEIGAPRSARRGEVPIVATVAHGIVKPLLPARPSDIGAGYDVDFAWGRESNVLASMR